MQHSPSRATDRESLQVDHNLELWECLREDVCSHLFSGTILDVHGFIFDGLADEVELNVEMFGECVVVVVGCEADSCLVVAEEGGGNRCDVKEGLYKATKPNAFLHCMSRSDVFSFCGG